MKKMTKIGGGALALVLVLGIALTGCSCSNSSSTDKSTKDAATTSNSSNASASAVQNSSSNKTDNNAAASTASSNSQTADSSNSAIVGSWRYESGMSNADYSYVFNADGTVKMINRLVGGEIDGKYVIQGNTITLETPSSPVASTPKEFRIEGNKLIIKDSAGNEIVHVRE